MRSPAQRRRARLNGWPNTGPPLGRRTWVPYHPRWLNHVYADLVGFFWLPCPNCGHMFGGHEMEEGHTIWDKQQTEDGGWAGRGTCPRCPIPETRWEEVAA